MAAADGDNGPARATGGIVSSGGKATSLSPSLVARVAQGVKYIIRGVPDDTWFGPSQPIQPAAQEAAGRVLDYQVGYNLLQRPRQETEAVVSFRELRQLSEACNIMRLAIETRKDQIGRLAWNIKLRDTGKKADDKKPDPRIAEIEAFFRRPDRESDWTTWLRQLIEDLLVIDAPTIYRRKDKRGKPYAFNIMDGALIKRLIDDDGLTPAPPDPAYQQILHGLAAVDYTTNDILYLPRNKRSHRLFGFSPVEQVVMMVNIAIRRSIAQLNYFTEGNIPEALISCPPDWRPQQIAEMQEIFDDMLKGDLAARSGAKFMPGGLNVQFTKDALLKDDFDEWLARIICFAFSIPPTAFVKQMNRASSQTQKESADEEGLAPLQQWVKSFMDQLLTEDFAAPDLEFVWYDDTAADPLILAQVNQIYVNTGIKTRNEVRGELGLDPIPDGDETTITTGTGVTRLADALEPPEPIPAALPAPGQQRTPPANDAKDDEPDVPPKGGKGKNGKKKEQTTKVDDLGDADKNTPASDENTDPHEAELTAILRAFLRRQRDRIASLIGGAEHTGQTPDAAFADADAADVLNSDPLVEPVAQLLLERAGESAQDELKALQETAGVDLAPEVATTASRLVNQEAVDYAQSRAAELVGRKLVDGKLVDNPDAHFAITDTTRDGLQKLIKQAEVEGKSVQQLTEEIRQSALFGKDRARMIAQTELSFADSNGNLIAWKASGVVTGKRSILGNEHKLCDQCDANAKAGVIGLDEPFPSGHQCTPFHPLCACGMTPVIVAR